MTARPRAGAASAPLQRPPTTARAAPPARAASTAPAGPVASPGPAAPASTTDRLHALTSRPRGRRFSPPGGRRRISVAASAVPPPRPPDGPPLPLSPYARAAHPPGEPALPPWLLRTHAELGPEAPRTHTPALPERATGPAPRPGGGARRAAGAGHRPLPRTPDSLGALAFAAGLATGLALLTAARLLPLLG